MEMYSFADKKMNGFGEDIVSGKRPHPPIPLTAADKQDSALDLNDFGPSLEQQQSRNYKTIQQGCRLRLKLVIFAKDLLLKMLLVLSTQGTN